MSPERLSAFARLTEGDIGKELVDYLSELLAEELNYYGAAPSDDVMRRQGRYQLARKVFEDIAGARDALVELKSREPGAQSAG